MATTAERRVPLIAAYAITFLAFFDTFAFLPTVGPRAEALGADPVLVGVIVGAYSLTNLATNPAAGVLIDRFGRRPLLLIGLALAVAAILAYPLAATPGQLLVLRLTHGIGGGIVVPAVFTLVGDLTGADRRARAMGRTGAAIGMAAIVAPPVAGAIQQLVGFTGVVLVVAAALALGALLAALVLHETGPAAVREAVDPASAEPETGHLLVDIRRLMRAGIGVFGFTFALGGLTGFLPFRVAELGGAPSVTGALLGLFAVIAAGLMLSPVADQARHATAARPLVAGLVLVTGSLVVLTAAGSIAVVALACALFGVGYAFVFPTAATEASEAAPGARRGRAFGIFHAAFSLGFVIGPPAAGWVADTAVGPFAVGAVAAAMAAGVVVILRPRPGREAP